MEVKVCSHLEPPFKVCRQSVCLGRVFTAARRLFFPYSVTISPASFQIHLQELRSLRPGVSHEGPGRGRNQRRAFVKIRARNERKLTNVIRPERLRLGGPIISNRPPVRFVCSSTCVFCMCEKSQMLETDFVSSQRSWDKKKKARTQQMEVLKETSPLSVQKETDETGNSLILIGAFASQVQ